MTYLWYMHVLNIHRYVAVCSVILLLAAPSCKKKGFKKIRETDQFGFTVAEGDFNDWQIGQEEFPKKIEEAMSDLECGEGVSGVTFQLENVVCYPNPTDGLFFLEFTAPYNQVKVVIASWTNRIVYNECHYTDQTLRLSLVPRDLGMRDGKYYRVYYEAYSDYESNAVRGHGDFLYMNNQAYYNSQQ